MASNLRKWYRRLRYGQPIVVVSGLPRSGTSMAMKMLEAGGLAIVTDGQRAADEDNPKGYYEDERVKDLAATADKGWLRAAQGRAIKVISALLRELPKGNNYRVVFMHRDLAEILASQAKMLARRGETSETSDERMRALYEDDLWKARWLLDHQPQFEAIHVDYADVLREPRVQAERMATFLGGALDVDKMVAMVDEQLYRNRLRKNG